MSSTAHVAMPSVAPPPAILGFAVSARGLARPAGAADASATLLSQLLCEAFEAFDSDHDAARNSLSRAVALLDTRPARPVAAPPPAGGLAPWQAKKAQAYIESHLEAPIGIGDLAALARLSRSYFSRAFKTTFGCAPQSFIQDRRIVHAQKLMLTSDEPLCAIALACGFSDQAHLSRIFRRLAGDSPNAWRRAHRDTPAEIQVARRCDA
jgi:AraC family transcriptional regulator